MICIRRVVAFYFTIFLLYIAALPVQAKDEYGTHNQKQEIVFLVDCSSSMKEADSNQLIEEFIRQHYILLPKNFEIGVVTYSTEAVTLMPLSSSIDEWDVLQPQINYQGYSNIGAGLNEALNLFTNNRETEKRIVLFSDGELDMPNDELAKQSYGLFESCLQTVRNLGIQIDMISIGEEIPEGDSIFSMLEEFVSVQYKLQDAGELAGLSKEYLFQMADITPVMTGSISGQEAQLRISLPDVYLDWAYLYLLGEQPGAVVNVGGKAAKIEVKYGLGYSVVMIERPVEEEINLFVSTSDNMSISVYLGAEYNVHVSAEAQYHIEEEKASIYLDLLTTEENSLLSGHLESEKNLAVSINNQPMSVRVLNGRLYGEYPMDSVIYPPGQTASFDIQITLPETYGIYYGDISTKLSVEVPIIEEEPKPQPDWFLIGVIVILILALVFLLIISKRKKKYQSTRYQGDRRTSFPLAQTGTEPEERSKYDYCGKISIYVLESTDGIEYPPVSLNLFASYHRQTITLGQILDTCKLALGIKDADKIIIKPGEGRSLLIKNNSKATAIKGRDVLLRAKQYEMHFHEKITFIFEDAESIGNQVTELELHYKDLKINER